jgi:hypothetical protein
MSEKINAENSKLDRKRMATAIKIQAITILTLFLNFSLLLDLKLGLLGLLGIPAFLAIPLLPIINLRGLILSFSAGEKWYLFSLIYSGGLLLSVIDVSISRKWCSHNFFC